MVALKHAPASTSAMWETWVAGVRAVGPPWWPAKQLTWRQGAVWLVDSRLCCASQWHCHKSDVPSRTSTPRLHATHLGTNGVSAQWSPTAMFELTGTADCFGLPWRPCDHSFHKALNFPSVMIASLHTKSLQTVICHTFFLQAL